ncbi:MAG: hypothetical protein U0793_28525 [Gemmataceae bacterium]
MQIPILIEPIEGGRYRVRAGEPFGLSAEGATSDEAKHALEHLIAKRLAQGAQVGVVDVPNGQPLAPLQPLSPRTSRYKTDPSYGEMQAAINEARRAEDAEEERRWKAAQP